MKQSEIILIKKVLFIMKNLKDNKCPEINVKDDLEYNLALVYSKDIPIDEFGEY